MRLKAKKQGISISDLSDLWVQTLDAEVIRRVVFPSQSENAGLPRSRII